MLRSLTILAALLVATGSMAKGAIWPAEFFGFKRSSLQQISPGAAPVWNEYGFEAGELAHYALKGRKFTATAYRFADSTSTMAVFQWKHPSDAKPSKLTDLAVEWANGAYIAFDNYIFRFDGYKPTEAQLAGLLLVVPELEKAPLPTFPGFLPRQGLIPGSKRYILGPESLKLFEPKVSPAVAGFHYGMEAQFAKYKSPKGDLKLEVYSYPTPTIARERLPEFRALPGVMVKRTGPLLAMVVDSPDPNESEKLLAKVNYRVSVTWDAASNTPALTVVDIILTSFVFIGILLLAAVIIGFLFGGFKFLRWWRSDTDAEDSMILLHIEDR